MRWVMIFTISSIEGLWVGSLDQQRVIRLSMGLGRFLMRGGRVPADQQGERGLHRGLHRGLGVPSGG